MNASARWFQPLATVLGYGSELSDALDRYSGADKSERDQILQAYAEWLQNCDHWKNICFADITFFTEGRRSVRDALTIVLTPPSAQDRGGNHREYVRALQDDYLAKNHTMAPHRVFAAGIPVCRKCNSAPETSADLDEFFKKCAGHPVESGMLFEKLEDVHEMPPSDSPPVPCVGLYSEELGPTYEKSQFTDRFAREVSEGPLREQWRSWIDVFRAERTKGALKSCYSAPLKWLAAIPVGYRDPQTPSGYEFVACVFLGFDELLDEAQARAAIRFILLNLFEANATQLAFRHGISTGKELLLVPAAHELKYMTDAIEIESLRRYFKLLLDPPSERISMSVVAFDLEAFIRAQIEEAAKIERIIVLSKKGRLRYDSGDTINSLLQEFVDSINAATIIDVRGHKTYTCPEKYRYYFELALLSAIRNVIKHTWRKSDVKFSIFIEDTWRAPELHIRNSFSGYPPQPVSEASPTGTLKAIRRYVDQYHMDTRKVIVRRVSKTPVDGQRKLESEEWQTVLPLPERESLT